MSITHASLGAIVFAFTGMVAISLAIDRHYSQASGRHDVPRWLRLALRSSGWLLIMVSLRFCIAGWGLSVGLVSWLGFLTTGALMVAGLLAYAPRYMVGAAILFAALLPVALY